MKSNSNIFNGSRCSGSYIHHLKENIYFYLKDFINKCPKEQILGVICTESLNKDMKRIFDIDVIRHEKKNNRYNKNITDESYEILKNYLKNDYMIINKMYKYCWISEEQYQTLIRNTGMDNSYN